ncbi:LOW QUALITY PROTEIN: kinesin-like protein KIN-7J [Brachypodium distachyon]|uniref:LOW QUALITY PROTEIN: kinesin-like protein KIN-7J n=1 Tax=Brachypodium distachyon TaxID=15368 RepID=UPI000D0D9ED4|nr:LOW QUALITY PROTEIN: kinesin-like protein KIN-7J [Brachypodium distachyon]|eukprot:XP_024310635.1 LOW QUALITY PROTEIN: kinesin-like protein KIN-7J [Brachypodium distachyon]
MAGDEERILVSVRLRPVNAREAERGDGDEWECAGPTTLKFLGNIPERAMFPATYTYDRVFSPECDTRQVYEEGAKEVALSVLSGINSSIFAYGQTSSGKTYTMVGVTEHSMAEIYGYIDQHPEREFILKFSAMEIYNEAVRDLLSSDATPLRLLDDPEKGTVVEKLTEETLRDKGHLLELLAVCEAQRQIGETALNETSSRSHQILRLTVESSARQFLGRGNSNTLLACVNFVDLAGSERASQTAASGMRLKEGSHINKSLLTLGKVIRQLSGGRNGHIPYRDSKLTRILQSSGRQCEDGHHLHNEPGALSVEQSRNTLLFANCAKNVVTNAQVNLVLSDKALVKHLQRELAKLENELKFPGSASCSSHAEALKEKDEQIKKLEEQLKELMEEKDTVQSQLENFRKVASDDHLNDHKARRWDAHSRSSESLPRNVSEDALSSSDINDLSYQDQAMDEQPAPLPRRPSNHVFDRITECQENIVASQSASEVSEEHCKEVRCIETNELRRRRSQEAFHAHQLEIPDKETRTMMDHTETCTDEEKHGESVTKTAENAIELYACDSDPSFDIEKSNTEDEPLALKRCVVSSRDIVLARSQSCKASFMVIPNSWFDDLVSVSMTPPPGEFSKHPPRRPEKVKKSLFPESVASDPITDNSTGNAEEESFVNDMSCVTEVKEQTEKNDATQPKENQVQVGIDLSPSIMESPSQRPFDFRKKQREIIELWHECHVSIVHRTYFFLLFNGDQTDHIYMEVEHRRLSFIKHSFIADGEPNATVATSLKRLRHERDMVYRQMVRRLNLAERESLFSKWGINLSSKQRRLQLSRLIWTRTDMEHVRESAALVSKMVEHLERGQAIKEMFGLNFSFNLRADRKSFSWTGGYS